jgi:hypothetical protein
MSMVSFFHEATLPQSLRDCTNHKFKETIRGETKLKIESTRNNTAANHVQLDEEILNPKTLNPHPRQ